MLSRSAPDSENDERVQQLPSAVRDWMTLERFHLHQPPLYQRMERDPQFDTGYLPQHCGVFQLPCFRVPRQSCYIVKSLGKGSGGMRFVVDSGGDESVLLPMHPSTLDCYGEFLQMTGARDAALDGVRIWAIPTSSTRTVLAWPEDRPEQATFVKTSLHSPVFGDRRITRIKAARSVGLSALIEAERDELPATLRYLPEPLAFTPRRGPDMGAIVRSIPYEIKQNQIRVAPLFSLIGGEAGRVPLLLTILERTGTAPLEFVHDVLCKPFAKLWLELALNHGLLLESHGQDLLLELSSELVPSGRFYYRDFEGLQLDWELRGHLGKRTPATMKGQWCWREAYATLGKHRYADLIWFKWRVSLSQYLHFVLHQTEDALRGWQREGRLGGAPIAQYEITMLFSSCLFEALEQMFGPSRGVRAAAAYNIYYRCMNPFLILLARLRRTLLRQPRSLGRAA